MDSVSNNQWLNQFTPSPEEEALRTEILKVCKEAEKLTYGKEAAALAKKISSLIERLAPFDMLADEYLDKLDGLCGQAELRARITLGFEPSEEQPPKAVGPLSEFSPNLVFLGPPGSNNTSVPDWKFEGFYEGGEKGFDEHDYLSRNYSIINIPGDNKRKQPETGFDEFEFIKRRKTEINYLQIQPPSIQRFPGVAVGFENMSANCWMNSLLQLVMTVRSFHEVYMGIADYHSIDESDHGRNMGDALEIYKRCLVTGTPVPGVVSQCVREAFNALINPDISRECGRQEDPYEALMRMIDKSDHIQRILLKEAEFFPPDLFCSITTVKHFTPSEEPSFFGKTEQFSKISEDYSISKTDKEFHIAVNLPESEECEFDDVFENYFLEFNASQHDSEPATYVVGPGLLQKFHLVSETKQFDSVPDQFSLVLKRFVFKENRSIKLFTKVAPPLLLKMPAEASKEGLEVNYHLTSFIVHKGTSADRGHYVFFKKIENEWFMLNDGCVAKWPEESIQKMLKGELEPDTVSYLHHYVKEGQKDLLIRSGDDCLVINNYFSSEAKDPPKDSTLNFDDILGKAIAFVSAFDSKTAREKREENKSKIQYLMERLKEGDASKKRANLDSATKPSGNESKG